ncbi:hypothetical protein NGM44_00280 [Moraxella sp. FZFQ2102]|uniref:hypothetical protein n=1 Tax=Moraxella sp. FZFQ2102 TaxID=2953752 RepID=UPI00209BBDCD|nr:hypothetical protein [Moraxella sp. FZFQ2102]USZ14874.1 hypothetical protein NGM44_00280 [Moraxella sp. FZFQ2102]
MLSKFIPDIITPKGIPKGMILLLIIACLLIGLSGLRYGGLEGWLHVLENWLVCLIIIPAFTALVAMPMKWRDDSFDVKMAYYLGMFVAFLFMMAKLRYWR